MPFSDKVSYAKKGDPLLTEVSPNATTQANTAYYFRDAGNSFDVSNEDDFPNGLDFNSDGTKMFMQGRTNDSVFEYDLSTAFDLSTATYNSISFDVSGQSTTTTDVTFNDDGTKMYVTDASDNDIYEYDLSTAFDLSTASYNSSSFSFSSQLGGSVTGADFSKSGGKLFVVDSNEKVYQYSLTTDFDITTATYDNISFDVSGEAMISTGIRLSSDGTKMFITSRNNSSVFGYDLSTAFDLSTASYSGSSFDIGNEESTPTGLSFDNSGSKLYIIGDSSIKAHSYSLSTAFDVSTATYGNTDTIDHTVQSNTEFLELIPVSSTMLLRFQSSASSSNWDVVLPQGEERYVLTDQVQSNTISVFSPNGGDVYIREV